MGDEKHLVFECTKLQHIKDRYARLFDGFDTMRPFMNQTSQQVVMNIISDCLDCDAQLVGGDHTNRCGLTRKKALIHRWGLSPSGKSSNSVCS